jgi:hypothetical protein
MMIVMKADLKTTEIPSADEPKGGTGRKVGSLTYLKTTPFCKIIAGIFWLEMGAMTSMMTGHFLFPWIGR